MLNCSLQLPRPDQSDSPAMHSPLLNKDLDRRFAGISDGRVGSIEEILPLELLPEIQQVVNLDSIVAWVVDKGDIIPLLDSYFRGDAIGGIGELQLT